MLKRNLLDIKQDILNHKNQDIIFLVKKRLNKTFNLYINQLEVSYNRLLQLNELRLLKKLSKED